MGFRSWVKAQKKPRDEDVQRGLFWFEMFTRRSGQTLCSLRPYGEHFHGE